VAAPTYDNAAVATAHPLATAAGIEMLQQGGNAVDAAVASALALSVVEPHASGLGGGGLMVIRLADGGGAHGILYRETAPGAITLDHYTDDAGELSSRNARTGGLAVATPGTVAGLHLALEKHGTLPWATVLGPAIRYAEEGFELSDKVAAIYFDRINLISGDPGLTALLMPDGLPLEAGDVLRQPRQAATLRALAEYGPSHIYSGPVAQELAETVQARGGVLSVEDLNHYQPVELAPLAIRYRGHTITTLGPPSVGACILGRTLTALEAHDLAAMDRGAVETVDVIAAALSEAAAVMRPVIGDPRHLPPGLDLDALLAGAGSAEAMADPGGSGNTSHLSVIDGHGNAVALTQTINYWLAAGILLPDAGFMLNNEMMDFTYEEGDANMPRPGARPATNMAPMILLDEAGEVIAVLGTPGGPRISSALVEILVNLIDFEMPIDEAINTSRFHPVEPGGRRLALEEGFADDVAPALTALGWEVDPHGPTDAYFGGAQALVRDPATDTLSGAADPRRDGTVDGF
jgi:gamma-glutamyltranspeptidase/glutathione hydrolase